MIYALKAFPQLRIPGIVIVNLTGASLLSFKHDEHIYKCLEEIEFKGCYSTLNEIQLNFRLISYIRTFIIKAAGHKPECVLVG